MVTPDALTAAAPAPLQAEISQSIPFPTRAVEAVLALERTADQLIRQFADALKPFGITPTQYNVLRILRGAGKKGLPTLEISQRMVTREPDMPRLIDRMEKAGLVARTRCTDDRRVVWCSLTDPARELMLRVDPMADSQPAEQMSVLSDEEQVALVGMLERVRASIRDRIR
jgi:MarR family transcriptional regulator, organic hydroperoxide resistance regulator